MLARNTLATAQCLVRMTPWPPPRAANRSLSDRRQTGTYCLDTSNCSTPQGQWRGKIAPERHCVYSVCNVGAWGAWFRRECLPFRPSWSRIPCPRTRRGAAGAPPDALLPAATHGDNRLGDADCIRGDLGAGGQLGRRGRRPERGRRARCDRSSADRNFVAGRFFGGLGVGDRRSRTVLGSRALTGIL